MDLSILAAALNKHIYQATKHINYNRASINLRSCKMTAKKISERALTATLVNRVVIQLVKETRQYRHRLVGLAILCGCILTNNIPNLLHFLLHLNLILSRGPPTIFPCNTHRKVMLTRPSPSCERCKYSIFRLGAQGDICTSAASAKTNEKTPPRRGKIWYNAGQGRNR